MAITTLDPQSALVVIDLQRGIVGAPAAHPTEKVVANSARLADAFRAAGLPVVLVHVEGNGAPGRTERRLGGGPRSANWSEFVPELGRQDGDHVVVKHTWGAFTDTGLAQWLRERGVTEIVLTGISTSAGVESTGRQAHELGFNVAFAIDAMTDRDPATHENSTERIFPKIGETGTVADFLDLLAARNV